jgi:oligoribonuclease
MTGLDVDKEEIMEIHCIITTGNLEIVDLTGWGVVVHQSAERMAQMDEWCTRTHGASGLTEAVIKSTISPEEAATGLLTYIQRYIPGRRIGLLAGNSVHADRAFLRKGPYAKVVDHLHYRLLDVSAIKEAAKRWCPPSVMNGAPKKKGLHLAKDDILESIAEARYFKDVIFAPLDKKPEGMIEVVPEEEDAWAENLL